MTFARARPSGWGIHSKLTSAEMNAGDSNWPYALDGLNGSQGVPYNPSTVIEITGTHGLKCSSPFQCTGTSTFTGTVNCNANTINVNGGNLNLVATTLGVDATSAIVIAAGGVLTCNGPATFNGTVTHNDNFSLNSAKVFSCAGTLALGTTGVLTGGAGALVNFTGSGIVLGAGTTVLNSGIIANAGAGRIRPRFITGVNNNHTYGANDADVIRIPAGFSGNWTWTITSTGAGSGDILELYLRGIGSGSHTITLVDDGAIQIGSAMQAGTISYTKLVYNGSNWDVVIQALTL